MTSGPLTTEAFADHPVGTHAALDHVAHQLTAEWSASVPHEMLVIALDPDGRERRVVSSAGNTAIRAAVSVAVAAGNTRSWNAAKGDAIAEVDIVTLPEIIRAAVTPAGIVSVHVAMVERDDRPACLLMWLSTATARVGDADPHVAHGLVLERLRAAIEVDRQQAEAAAEHSARLIGDRGRPVVIETDLLGTMLDRAGFERALGELESEEAGLLAVSIDEAATLPHVELLVQRVAERLAVGVRKLDVIGRIGEHSFGVLLVDVDRHSAFEISKRLRASLATPIEVDDVSVTLDLSVGLAHEVGLIEPEELFASAESAMREARQAGGARMLVAS